MATTEEINKAALKSFYEKKDPHRVKNVDPLFLRYEMDDILYYVEQKYGESVEGWVGGDSNQQELSSPIANEQRKSQGFFAAARTLSQRAIRKSLAKSSQDENLRKSLAESAIKQNADTRSRIESDDSDVEVRSGSNSFLPPQSPMASAPSMAEIKMDSPEPAKPASPESAPAEVAPAASPSPTHSVKGAALTKEEIDRQIDEIKAREREALEQARAEERRIQEALAKGREAIERAKRELEEKERELEEAKKKMEAEARQQALAEAKGEAKPAEASAPASSAKEEYNKMQAEIEQKQIEAIQQLEAAERERIELEEKKQIVQIEEAERAAKLQIIENLTAPDEPAAEDETDGGETKAGEEEQEEGKDVVGDLPATSSSDEAPSIMTEAPKRMTLYERKLQAALEAPAAPDGSADQPVSSSGRKTLLGGLVGRFTKRKTNAQPASPPPPAAAPAPEPVPEEPAAASEPEPEPQPAPAPVVETPAAPAPLIAPPTTVVKDLAVDELEQWKLRALEAETRSKILQMEAEERARKFQMEAEERIKKLEAMAAAAFKAQAEQAQAPAPAPASAAPAAPAPAASSGGGGGVEREENGYRVLPRDHIDLNKYHKMAKAGLPQGAVENAMIREGIHPKSVFDNPMNNPGPKKPIATPATAAAAESASSGGAPAPGADGEFKRPPMDSPDLEKYKKMQKAGLPQGAIENAMMRDFFHPAALFGANALNDPKPVPKKPAAAAPPAGGAAKGGAGEEFKRVPQDSPDLEKYRKMQKAGLPQGAIENAMMRDFFHPASLFGKNAINDPKPKPALGGAKAAAKPAPAAAPAAAAAPAGDPNKPPPGMSMMEEMKWRQAQKAKMPPKQFVEPVKKVEEKPAPAVAAPPGANDKPPPGLSMMEEMKWKQAQKAAMAAAGQGPAPFKEPPKKAAPAPAPAPNFKVGLKSTAGGVATTAPAATGNKPAIPAAKPATSPLKPPSTPIQSWNKPPPKAVVQAAASLASAPPPPNVDALVNLFVGAKISAENAKKYATVLAAEGFDAPDKLALLDEGDLKACGITARFDTKTILTLKSNLPKPAAAPAAAPAAKPAAKPGAAAAATTTPAKPGFSAPTPGKFVPAAPKPPGGVTAASTAAKPGAVPAASTTAKPGAVPAASTAAKPGAVPATSTAAKPGLTPAAAKPGGAAAAASSLKGPSIPPSTGGFQKPALRSGAADQAKKEADRLAFVLALGAPMDAYKKPKQIG